MVSGNNGESMLRLALGNLEQLIEGSVGERPMVQIALARVSLNNLVDALNVLTAENVQLKSGLRTNQQFMAAVIIQNGGRYSVYKNTIVSMPKDFEISVEEELVTNATVFTIKFPDKRSKSGLILPPSS